MRVKREMEEEKKIILRTKNQRQKGRASTYQFDWKSFSRQEGTLIESALSEKRVLRACSLELVSLFNTENTGSEFARKQGDDIQVIRCDKNQNLLYLIKFLDLYPRMYNTIQCILYR